MNNTAYRYQYDLAGRVQRMYGSDGYKLRNIYDAKGNIYNTLYTFADNDYITAYSNNYIYGDDNQIDTVRFNQTGVEIGRTYDGLGRVTKKEYSKASKFFTTEYSFLAGANENTTGILSSVTNNNETIAYTYDDNGNISRISEGNTEKARYAYDGLNQLVREDNKYLNKSMTYTYDVGGNLTSKKEYAYTIEALGTPIRTINYTYGDSNWKDKLTAYDGKTITYDAIGNPLTYNGNTYAWTGRQLDSISGNGNTVSYKYNAEGIRTGKTINGVTTKYFIEGDRIVLEKVGDEERAFWYDGDGNAAAFVIYDSTGKHPYYYMRNGQGDIIGLFDVTGAVVARYTYDSWGKLVSITDGNGNDKTNDTSFVGYKNPLRYRGYYYDNETGLYYLQSRYYNPEWGRYLNADDPDILQTEMDTMHNKNLFAYCDNNPVNRYDPSGYFWKELADGLLKGAAIALGVAAAAALVVGTGGTALALVGGGVLIDAVAATAVTAAATSVALGTASVAASAANQMGNNFNYAKQSKKSGKELSSDKPSWVNRGMVDFNKSAHHNAKRLMDQQFGAMNWSASTADRAYSKILKWLTRSLGLK